MYKVLVVDDKPSQVEMICAMLSRIHIECIPAYSGIDAVKIAKETQPHLIIMDWVMPAETLTGSDAVQQILSDKATDHIPIIACSAASNLRDVLSIGCVDCLAKPFHLHTLHEKVQQYLN